MQTERPEGRQDATRQVPETKHIHTMKNTEYNLETLSAMISSEASFQALVDMISDMGLEIQDVRTA